MDKSTRDEFIGADADIYEPTPDQLEYLFRDIGTPLNLFAAMAPKIKENHLTEALKLRFGMVPIIGELELYGAPVNSESYKHDIDKAKEMREVVEKQVVEQLTPPVLEWRVEEFDKKLAVWQEWKQKYQAVKEDSEVEGGIAKVNTQRERRDMINEWNRRWKEQNPAPAKPKLDSGPINLNSPQQVLAALGRLGYRFESTTADEFEDYASQLEQSGSSDPLIQPFLTYKRLQKIVAAFGDPILEKIEDNIIRPEWNLMVTTGRMSCRKPNLQQVPKPVTLDGYTIDLRRHFEAPDGFLIARMDFSNIELRIAADLSGDQRAIEDFIAGMDFHGRTAATKLGITYDEGQRLKRAGDREFLAARDAAKIDNFGTIYGAWNKQWIDVFSTTYPQMWAWLEREGAKAIETRKSVAADGFIKWWVLPPQPDKRYELQEWLEWKKLRNRIIRQAKNLPIQSTSAAITMAAAIAVDFNIKPYVSACGDVRMWNIVHDELDLLMRESYRDYLPALATMAEEAGQRYLKEVPCVVESSLSKYWSK